MKHPKHILNKISMWWRGADDGTELLTYWAESANDDFRPTLHPPLKTVREFLKKHWKFIISSIIAITLGVLTIIFK